MSNQQISLSFEVQLKGKYIVKPEADQTYSVMCFPTDPKLLPKFVCQKEPMQKALFVFYAIYLALSADIKTPVIEEPIVKYPPALKKQYTLLSKAWYGPSNLEHGVIDEVIINLYYPDGSGFAGEIVIRWYELSGTLSQRLEVFNDGWYTLSLFPELHKLMASIAERSIEPEAFCKNLDRIGIKDNTKVTRDENS